MKFEFHNKKSGAFLGFTDNLQDDESCFAVTTGVVKIIWNRSNDLTCFYLDDQACEFKPGQVLTSTFFHHINFTKASSSLTAFTFNREFYCLLDHDSEVSCNGILFFGTQEIPRVTIPVEQVCKFDTLYDMFMDEFNTPDKIQGDMLQMLLKRLIIMCTRLAKEQLCMKKIDVSQVDTVRRFNFLVDVHFKTKRQVNDYADLLNKSPKTLSNLFLLYNQKTPQQIIHERVALEAKRLLHFSEKNAKEIAFELGFDTPAHFSRFFKKMVGITPSDYKEQVGF